MSKEPPRRKGKEVMTSFKVIAMTDANQAKKQKIKETPKEEKLRDDAYDIAIDASHPGEYIFPYIPISTKWVIAIDNKYSHLKPNEVVAFYFKNNADSFVYPKDYQYFQDILVATNSVEFDSTGRSGGEIAYSKAIIHRVIRPEQWANDLFQPHEMTRSLGHKNIILKFNYFNYIDAWEHAFYYENKQRKFSWFVQFHSSFMKQDLPNWFLNWYVQWGLYPISLPHKIRNIFEDFEKINSSLKNQFMWFTILYQIPWIVRWEPIIAQRNLSKLGQTIAPIPYFGRKIMIKWWAKFNFFENSVFATKGLINLEPPKPPKPDVSELFKQLTANMQPEDLSKLFDLIRQKEESSSSQMSEDEPMQDSQDPYDL